MPGENTQPKPKTAAKAQAQTEETAKVQTESEAVARVQTESAETKTVSLRHKTPYRLYRRAGLTLTQIPKAYHVTHAQLATLKADTWVEVLEG